MDEGMPLEGSLRDRLRAARATKQAEHIEELPIPGYGGQLVARYRNLDYVERRQIGLGVKGPSVPARELDAAADMLVRACVGVDAHVDGQVVPVKDGETPLKLGKALADYLGQDGAETDRQAIFLIFPSQLSLMAHVEQLSALQLAADDEIDGELAEN